MLLVRRSWVGVTALFVLAGAVTFWIATIAWTGAMAAIGVASFFTAWLLLPGVLGYHATRGVLVAAILYLAAGLAWVQVWNSQLRSANGLTTPGYTTPVEVGTVTLTWTWQFFQWVRGGGT